MSGGRAVRHVAMTGALLAPWAHAATQDLVRPEDAVVAVFSLQTELEVDARQLERFEERHEQNRLSRIEARERVARLYVEMDELFARYRAALKKLRAGMGAETPRDKEDDREGAEREGPSAGDDGSVDAIEAQIESKEQELRSAERAESAVLEDGRRLREDIRSMRERMMILSQRIATLQQSLPAQRDSVTGVWDISMLPGSVTGVFALFQSGTLVSGQYVLEGPFQGSLDGTLIDRKLLLHRIDNRLGRSMDLTGTLSPDGQILRGTWENYDLSNGQTRTGSWSARRRAPRRAVESGGQEGGS